MTRRINEVLHGWLKVGLAVVLAGLPPLRMLVMIHSLSFFAAEIPPAICLRTVLAMLVSSTSTNVAVDTAAAMNRKLSLGRGARRSACRVAHGDPGS